MSLAIAGYFPGLPPLPAHRPTLGLVRREDTHPAPVLGGNTARGRSPSAARSVELRRIDMALCRVCGEPAALDKHDDPEEVCEAHRSPRTKQRAWQLAKRAKGLCEYCGANPVRLGAKGQRFRACLGCLARRRVSVAASEGR